MKLRISRTTLAVPAVLALLGAAACASPAASGDRLRDPVAGAPVGSVSGLAGPVYPGTDEGARALMRRLGAVGDRALMQALQPADADYEALFQPSFAARARGYYTHLWATLPPADHPLAAPEQTELSLAKGATEHVRAWTPQIREDFPAGYRTIKEQLRPGSAIYVWRYLVPGRGDGVVCDGLVFVNGHWAYFPSPWKAA